MTEVIRIIAAVVDTQRLTMYREDGSTIVIPQGDARIRTLVDKVVPALESQNFCDLSVEDLSVTSHYSHTENSTNGFVQFFRTFKSTMETLLSQFAALDQEPATAPPVAPVAVGALPVAKTAAQSAVSEIMANATPVSSPDFHAPMTEQETVVAVLSSGEMIPGIEKIDLQLQGVAARLGSAQGVQAFFQRVGSVKRAHSVQDLLTFMQKGELPIADDGSVLVYKRLQSTKEEGVFVDCHSGNVKQRIGSHVFMDEKLVDPNRSQDCSNGLHVARRDYLSSFSGNVCVLAKLAPEDVIAVPHSDARKLRAKGYHIIAQLSEDDANRVCRNQPMQDTVLLGNAVKGNHAGVLETVEIRGHKGANLLITAMDTAAPVVLDEAHKAESLDHLPTQNPAAAKVDAAALAKQVTADRKSSRQLKAEELLIAVGLAKFASEQMKAAKALLDYKKAAKVSWEKLGITDKEVIRITEIASGKTDIKAAPVAKPAKAKPVKATAPSRVVNEVETGLGTPKQRIRALLDKGLTSVGVAQAIIKLKKDAKKGWDKLGVNDAELAKILKLAGK